MRRNEALDDFASIVAHELKGSLLAAASGDPDGVGRALDLVDDLLDPARSEGADGWAESRRGLDDALRDLPEPPSAIESDVPPAFPLPQPLLASSPEADRERGRGGREHGQGDVTTWRAILEADGRGRRRGRAALGGWEQAAAGRCPVCGICADRFILRCRRTFPGTMHEEATVTTVAKQARAHGLTSDS